MRGRMRKLTLGRFPETVLADAKNEAAAVLARVWTGGANIVMNPGARSRAISTAPVWSASAPCSTGTGPRSLGQRRRCAWLR